MKTVVSMQFGSHLYGTSTPASDLDFKSVFIPDARDILLQACPKSINEKPQKAAGEKNSAGDIDREGFALHRYLDLLGQGQTVALDMLFTPRSMMQSEPLPVWKTIFDHRMRLVSRSASSFVGYCRTQANKYGIKGSRIHAVRHIVGWFDEKIGKHGHLAKVHVEGDTLVDFIRDNKLDHTEVIDIEQASRPEPVLHLSCCNRKIPFTTTLKEARAVYSRLLDEYGARALLAERNEGVDWKALSHAVRVGHEAMEFFQTGNITFPLPDAKRILSIKKGEIPFKQVGEEIEELLVAVEQASLTSVLASRIDTGLRDQIICEAYGECVAESLGLKLP